MTGITASINSFWMNLVKRYGAQQGSNTSTAFVSNESIARIGNASDGKQAGQPSLFFRRQIEVEYIFFIRFHFAPQLGLRVVSRGDMRRITDEFP
jgi:hypothetical protein